MNKDADLAKAIQSCFLERSYVENRDELKEQGRGGLKLFSAQKYDALSIALQCFITWSYKLWDFTLDEKLHPTCVTLWGQATHISEDWFAFCWRLVEVCESRFMDLLEKFSE